MTARDDFTSKERGFRLGIDDYVVKPVNLDELVLRIEALLRRANIAAKKKLTVGNPGAGRGRDDCHPQTANPSR